MSPQKSHFFGGSPMIPKNESIGERKYRSNLKGDLVRKEFLSRGDLIKLY